MLKKRFYQKNNIPPIHPPMKLINTGVLLKYKKILGEFPQCITPTPITIIQ